MTRHPTPAPRLASVLGLAAALVVAGPAGRPRAQITRDNWGRVVSPVYGSSAPDRDGAERFAGPKQFGDDYYHGVLPNGRIVKPAGQSVQVGMNPLGVRLTPDGRFLVVTNDNDENASVAAQHDAANTVGYSLSVIDTATMKVVSRISAAGRFYVGLQITGRGPYTVWASGGGDNDVKRFTLSPAGAISAAGRVAIPPMTPGQAGLRLALQPARRSTPRTPRATSRRRRPGSIARPARRRRFRPAWRSAPTAGSSTSPATATTASPSSTSPRSPSSGGWPWGTSRTT